MKTLVYYNATNLTLPLRYLEAELKGSNSIPQAKELVEEGLAKNQLAGIGVNFGHVGASLFTTYLWERSQEIGLPRILLVVMETYPFSRIRQDSEYSEWRTIKERISTETGKPAVFPGQVEKQNRKPLERKNIEALITYCFAPGAGK